MQSDMADSMAPLSSSDSRATHLLTLNLSDLQKSTPQNRLKRKIIKIVVLDPREFMFLHNMLKFEVGKMFEINENNEGINENNEGFPTQFFTKN